MQEQSYLASPAVNVVAGEILKPGASRVAKQTAVNLAAEGRMVKSRANAWERIARDQTFILAMRA